MDNIFIHTKFRTIEAWLVENHITMWITAPGDKAIGFNLSKQKAKELGEWLIKQAEK